MRVLSVFRGVVGTAPISTPENAGEYGENTYLPFKGKKCQVFTIRAISGDAGWLDYQYIFRLDLSPGAEWSHPNARFKGVEKVNTDETNNVAFYLVFGTYDDFSDIGTYLIGTAFNELDARRIAKNAVDTFNATQERNARGGFPSYTHNGIVRGSIPMGSLDGNGFGVDLEERQVVIVAVSR